MRKWSRKVILRYSLLQLPGLVMLIVILALLRHWIQIPPWTVWTGISLWVIKDVILFPFVWRAYDREDSDSMTGLHGTAADRLSPYGHVRIRGETWRAKVVNGDPAVEKGETVTVRGVRGLTLLVESDRTRKKPGNART